MIELKDRVAVVTGGGSGIGAAMARAFAAEGMRIVLADIEEPAMEATAASIRADVLAVRTDVTKLDDLHTLAERAFTRFGGVHLLCNNAGVVLIGGLEAMTHRDWEWMLGVNLWGVINGLEAFLPRMIAQKQGGHIVNTASMSGLVPMQSMGVYVTTKYAVVGLSETLHRDLSQYGIGVSVLCPMVVNTQINAAARNRPAELRNPGEDPFMPPQIEMVGGVIEAPEVAAGVVAAVKANELYVLTHKAQRDIIRRRFERLDRAAAKVSGG
jgi:NAD(P)-dependent dehydrogenase (short-subunit alcohol dehydrogenase family)